MPRKYCYWVMETDLKAVVASLEKKYYFNTH